MCGWMFSAENLELLLLIEPAPSFEVLLVYLSPDISSILNNLRLFEGNDYIVINI